MKYKSIMLVGKTSFDQKKKGVQGVVVAFRKCTTYFLNHHVKLQQYARDCCYIPTKFMLLLFQAVQFSISIDITSPNEHVNFNYVSS